MKQHTPGPWLAHGIDDDGCDPPTRSVWVTSCEANSSRNVCQVVDHGPDGPMDDRAIGPGQLKADAALIAAAPELLKACETALYLLGMMGNVFVIPPGDVRSLELAIAKARGEGPTS